MKQRYAVTDKSGNIKKIGLFTEPEIRMAAKAGLRIFKLDTEGKYSMELTQELTGLFPNDRNTQNPGTF